MAKIEISDMEVRLLKGLPILSDSKIKGLKFLDEFKLMESPNVFLETMSLLYDQVVAGDFNSMWKDSEGISKDERPQMLLFISIHLIRMFVQLNSTGPLENDITPSTKALYEQTLAREKLGIDGCEVSEHVVMPMLLVVALEFLEACSVLDSDLKEKLWVGKLYGWWGLRIHYLHQRILDGRSMTLATKIDNIITALQPQFENYDKMDLDLKVLWLCEVADIHLYYYNIVAAKACLQEASKVCGIEIFTTGVLGKKTKFQTQDLAQLVVQAKVEGKYLEATENLHHLADFQKFRSVVDVSLNDETRLEKVKISAEADNVLLSLTTVQQVLLLAELNYMKKSQPKDELMKEEILAYVNSLLEDPKIWSCFVVALLYRSMTETDHFRTVERSMMQFENLQKAVSVDQTPSFHTRYQFFHATPMPLKWEIDIALADILSSLGQVKAALDIYLKLNLWENVIACYNLLELKHKAEEVIREQISKTGESPKLLVYLGDATDDITLYEKAWELSQHKNFLSRQRLGGYWFRKQEYQKAIPYLKEAVELNPLEFPTWIRLAYACLESENWELCVKAYVHANNLDDESFENWNNLAKAALKLGNKDQALRALKQATKCNYEEWKVWENLLVVALQCMDLEWTIMAFNRLIELKGSYVDVTVLKLLVDLVCDDSWDKKGDASNRTKDALQKLLGRITSKITTNADVWQCYSAFLYKQASSSTEVQEDKWYNMVNYQQKAVRCRIQEKNWDAVLNLTENAIESVEILCKRTRDFLKALPNNPASKDLKIQAEFLHRQISNTVERKIKQVINPEPYSKLSISLQEAGKILFE